jgi:purine-binding chemotaxis protein CheW
VPFARPWLRGVTAVRGAVVSVVDLGAFAGLAPAGQTARARLLVTRGHGLVSALLVDRVLRVVRAPVDEAAAAGPGPLAAWGRGRLAVDGYDVPVLDVDQLMASSQFLTIQESGEH